MLCIRSCSAAGSAPKHNTKYGDEDEIALTSFPCLENMLLTCGERCRELSLCFRDHRDRRKTTDFQATCNAVASPTLFLTTHPASWNTPWEQHRVPDLWGSCFSPDLCLQIAPPSFFSLHSVREYGKQEGSNTCPCLSLHSRDKHKAADGKQMPQVLQISCLQPFPQSCS